MTEQGMFEIGMLLLEFIEMELFDESNFFLENE